ncbi:hypothetical protein K6V18_26065 [Ralstonia insidiosa]|uniref:hypothetical protein n=1 Tax=Ralstonia TaxID=48736 RepID=UPI0012EEBAC1|nr:MULTISPECIES: hypothetical protein [Ralstonia]MBY4708508.1 hypothetical protein [Ralstonia insidiosa]
MAMRILQRLADPEAFSRAFREHSETDNDVFLPGEELDVLEVTFFLDRVKPVLHEVRSPVDIALVATLIAAIHQLDDSPEVTGRIRVLSDPSVGVRTGFHVFASFRSRHCFSPMHELPFGGSMPLPSKYGPR